MQPGIRQHGNTEYQRAYNDTLQHSPQYGRLPVDVSAALGPTLGMRDRR